MEETLLTVPVHAVLTYAAAVAQIVHRTLTFDMYFRVNLPCPISLHGLTFDLTCSSILTVSQVPAVGHWKYRHSVLQEASAGVNSCQQEQI